MTYNVFGGTLNRAQFNSTKFSMHVAHVRGSVLLWCSLWRRCEMLRTSGFVDVWTTTCLHIIAMRRHR